MKIKVLGCFGAELPGHNLPGFLLDNEILFDAGSLTNVLDENSQYKIKNIFITHAHLDHIKSIPFFADNLIIKNKRHNVNIISIPPVIQTIKENLLNNSVWPDFTVIPDPHNAVINLVKIMEGESVKIKDYLITPFKVNHPVPAVGYLAENSKKRLFYTGDTGPTDSTWEKIGEKKIDCLIIEVSFPNRMREVAVTTGHLTPSLLKEEVLKLKHMPEKVYITHSKPQYFKVIKAEIEKLKIKNLRLLKDGERFQV
jgi:ribonuclease BN (tRNA processing enzyme)